MKHALILMLSIASAFAVGVSYGEQRKTEAVNAGVEAAYKAGQQDGVMDGIAKVAAAFIDMCNGNPKHTFALEGQQYWCGPIKFAENEQP